MLCFPVALNTRRIGGQWHSPGFPTQTLSDPMLVDTHSVLSFLVQKISNQVASKDGRHRKTLTCLFLCPWLIVLSELHYNCAKGKSRLVLSGLRRFSPFQSKNSGVFFFFLKKLLGTFRCKQHRNVSCLIFLYTRPEAILHHLYSEKGKRSQREMRS